MIKETSRPSYLKAWQRSSVMAVAGNRVIPEQLVNFNGSVRHIKRQIVVIINLRKIELPYFDLRLGFALYSPYSEMGEIILVKLDNLG